MPGGGDHAGWPGVRARQQHVVLVDTVQQAALQRLGDARRPHRARLQRRGRAHIELVVVAVVVVVTLAGLVYVRVNSMWCWSTRYSKLPCSDSETPVVLTEHDFNDEDELT